jgi:hypothetical protein
MTSLEYYIEQIEQFISALTNDIESGEGTVVTQTKLAVYREVLEHLEEIQEDIMTMTKDEALRGLTIGDCRTRREAVKTVKELLNREECEDAISRQAVYKIIDDIRDCVSVNGYWAFIERLNKLPPVNPQQPCGDAISRTEVIKSIDEREDVNGKVDAESVRTDIVLIPPVNTQKCDACEVGNPCLYCRHEFEPQESEIVT